MKAFIDIHTHHVAKGGYVSVLNRYSNFETATEGLPCSLGIHPWYVTTANQDDLWNALQQYASLSNVYAIGECGLDKGCTTNWDLQLSVFRRQIQLANKLHKPLIVHCVRAYEEVIATLQEEQIQVPVVFHGFNKNVQLAKQLIGKGYYLSYGVALINNSNAQESIKTIPIDRLLLETDDSTLPIEKIYEAAAGLLKTDTDNLILQVQKNFQVAFNI